MNTPSENKVMIKVIKSECKLYNPGDQILIDGPLIDTSKSANVCVTALNAIYPFIFALRKKVTPEALGFEGEVTVQCPDYCAPVIFSLHGLTDE
jgi:uncharacterized repeat protein (TIGR04076 family)